MGIPHIDLWSKNKDAEVKRKFEEEEIIGKIDNIIFLIKRYSCIPEYLGNEYEIWIRDAAGNEKKLKGTRTYKKKIHAYEKGLAVIRYFLKKKGEI